MKHIQLALVLLGATLGFFPACGGGGDEGGGSAANMDLQVVSNGFGQILPHSVFRLDAAGNPTQTVIPIRTEADLIDNVRALNPILPVPQYPPNAIVPSGLSGNHFMYAQFDKDIDVTSVLDPTPGAQPSGGITGAITLVALDPATNESFSIPVRVFVNGSTYSGTPTGTPLQLPLQQWVRINDTTGLPEVAEVDGAFPGTGFPGTPGSEFSGSANLISPKTIVFVADSDSDLTTFEVFPADRQIKMKITTSVRATNGRNLLRQGLAATTVGSDTLRPELATSPPPLNTAVISPGNGQTDVDPMTTIRVEFTEPIQPLSLGPLPSDTPPIQSSAMSISFGPAAAPVSVPFTVTPVSVFDLSNYILTPAFNFPGQGPDDFQCGVFNEVTVTANSGQIIDLAVVPNSNLVGALTSFETGEGPGLVNVPVTPDTIYVGRSGAIPGISVIDLNGFGQGTGNPTFSQNDPIPGNSNFPNNPNVRLQGATLRPPLQPGTCTINGGSAGVFTLAKDSSLNNLVVRPPILTSVGDMMIGHALDGTFNNGPAPFGCQAGGGNLCAFDGKKLINPNVNGNSMIPFQTGQANGIISPGAENLVCWGPHPNPPPLIFPPLCISPFIGGQEPTSTDTTILGLTNLLGPGDYFGQPAAGIPPSGLLTPEQNNYFEGPSLPQPTIPPCNPYMVRQQIGHYLYIIDRGRRELVILNSNRMTVIDRIPTQDPTTLAMSPNLNLLAVVNQTANLVSFLDIDPLSSTFHQVVQETIVGNRPRGVAWDPSNEDILVCNENENTMSIISAASLTVRKTVRSQLNGPFDVAITPRQLAWGFNRNVYFAYVLNRSGRVAIFESGPNTVNGWGYDDIIGIAPSTFLNPKAIQPDHVDLRSGVWIAHEGPIDIATDIPGALGVPAVSKLVIESGIAAVLPLNFTSLLIPQFRDLFLGVSVSVGPPQLSGIPVDIAFDDLRNLGGLPNVTSFFSAGAPEPINGKQLVRFVPNVYVNTNEPRYMFVAVPSPTIGTGVVDVVRVDGGFVRIDTDPYTAGIQSIPVPNCQVVTDYFRQ
ncbi:MAG: YncE family protein [Planctomycetota bacterium]